MSVKRLLRPGRYALAGMAGSALTLALVGGVMLATGTGFADGATIYGCVKNGSGLLRIVGGPGSCGEAETPLQWQEASSTALSIRQRTGQGSIPAHGWEAAVAECMEGEVATGGGYSLAPGGAPVEATVVRSAPGTIRSHLNPPAAVEAWIVIVRNDGDAPLDVWANRPLRPWQRIPLAGSPGGP